MSVHRHDRAREGADYQPQRQSAVGVVLICDKGEASPTRTRRPGQRNSSAGLLSLPGTGQALLSSHLTLSQDAREPGDDLHTHKPLRD